MSIVSLGSFQQVEKDMTCKEIIAGTVKNMIK